MEKADLAVPDTKTSVCDRCFAPIAGSDTFCPECGAPRPGEDNAAADAPIYQELARANLLRMRGDYRAAEEQCLAILRKFPNNASANTLLGDIFAEKGDPDQAVQWFELSLDLVENPAVRAKLAETQRRIRDRETAQTAEQLGLPTSRSKVGLLAIAVLLLIGVIGTAAYFLGKQSENRQAIVRTTSEATDPVPIASAPIPSAPEPSTNAEPKATRPSTAEEDTTLLERLQGVGGDATPIVHATSDPRTRAVTVTAPVLSGEPNNAVAARIGRVTLATVPDAGTVTIRLLDKGRTVYFADVSRLRMVEVDTPEFNDQNPSNPEAWISHVIQNEWTAPLTGGPAASLPPQP